MEGKNTGAVVFTLLFIMFCAVIGSCFMAFIYPTKQIKVDNPKLIRDSGISVKNEGGEELNELSLSTLKTGLKPVTGEEDDEYEIPITVTDKQGSEGLYSKFYLTSDSAWSLYITNIQISSESNASVERKHIKVGLKDVSESSQTLEGDKVKIASGEVLTEPKEFTFYVWLHASAGSSLVGSTISFDLSFEH